MSAIDGVMLPIFGMAGICGIFGSLCFIDSTEPLKSNLTCFIIFMDASLLGVLRPMVGIEGMAGMFGNLYFMDSTDYLRSNFTIFVIF